jgi:hypothetical protein
VSKKWEAVHSFIKGASLCGINSLDRERGKKAVVPPWVFEEESAVLRLRDAGAALPS